MRSPPAADGAHGGSASGGYDHPTQVYGENGHYVAYPPHYYGGSFFAGYHPPTTVDYYGNTCHDCGGRSGGAVAAAGASGVATSAALDAGAAARDEVATVQTTNTASYAAGVVAG